MNKLAVIAILLALAATLTGLGQVAARLNKQASHSPSLSDWKGLTCTVYLRVDGNPSAGLNSFSSGTSFAGLHTVAEMPTSAIGVLVAATDDCVVINGGNGYVWIPRDQIRCIEAMQDAPSK